MNAFSTWLADTGARMFIGLPVAFALWVLVVAAASRLGLFTDVEER